MSIQSIFATIGQVKQGLENLSVEQLKRELAQREDLLLVDVREIQEYVDLGAIPGAHHAPRGMLEFWADPASPYYRDYFQPDKRVVLYCGRRRPLRLGRQGAEGHGLPRRRPLRGRLQRLGQGRRSSRTHRRGKPLDAQTWR